MDQIPASPSAPEPHRRVIHVRKFILGGLLLILAIALFGSGSITSFVSRRLTGIRGSYIDGAYFRDGNGNGRVWFQTDGSFRYVLRKETPGSISISTKSIFNKTYSYLYDPAAEQVLRETRKDYPRTPPHPKVFERQNAAWLVTPTIGGQDPNIEVIDPATGNQILDLPSFIAKFPELKAGIAELSIQDIADEPVRFRIKTKDGQNFIYFLSEDALFASVTEYKNLLKKSGPREVTVFALASDGDRGELYRVTAPPWEIFNESFNLSWLRDADNAKFFYDAISTRLVPEQVFLKGLLLYQDSEAAVIVHQSEIGKKAERLLTAVDGNGNVLWTIPQGDLLPELALKENDGFTDIFFLKSHIRGKRVGDVFVLKRDDAGMMGIDMKTGARLWMFRPS